MVWHCRGAGELRTTTSTWQGGTSYRLLEKALGRRNPDLFRYAVCAMEAANPNDCFPNASG